MQCVHVTHLHVHATGILRQVVVPINSVASQWIKKKIMTQDLFFLILRSAHLIPQTNVYKHVLLTVIVNL